MNSQNLKSVLEEHSPALVAVSGGLDSSVLLAFAKQNGVKVAAFCAVTEFIKTEDVKRAETLSNKLDVEFIPAKLNLLESVDIRKNPKNRCYLCKKLIMNELAKTAKALGYEYVWDASHVGDLSEDRPGRAALKELGVISPFEIAGLDKPDILKLADELGIEKIPSSSCLAARIPFGEEITISKLERVEQAEEIMRNAGIKGILRVRVSSTGVAVETEKDELSTAEENIDKLKETGFETITVREYGKTKQ